MRALVIQHDDNGPAGHVSDWLAARGAYEDLFRIAREQREPNPRDYALIVSLGSEHAAYDDSVPWLGLELELLRRACDAGVPVLGICFGSQLLARALGGEARAAPHAEIGWVGIRTRDRGLVEPGPWLQWHYDTFTVPVGATLVAESPAGPQAYTSGRCLGIQFHPEVTSAIVEDWVDHGHRRLVRAGVDPDRLLGETSERDGENRARAWQLLDRFWERVAGVTGSRNR